MWRFLLSSNCKLRFSDWNISKLKFKKKNIKYVIYKLKYITILYNISYIDKYIIYNVTLHPAIGDSFKYNV